MDPVRLTRPKVHGGTQKCGERTACQRYVSYCCIHADPRRCDESLRWGARARPTAVERLLLDCDLLKSVRCARSGRQAERIVRDVHHN